MFQKATFLLALALLALPSGLVWADEPPVPATSLIPDDVVLVVRVTEPKALIERHLTNALCSSFNRCLPTKKPWPRRRRSRR